MDDLDLKLAAARGARGGDGPPWIRLALVVGVAALALGGAWLVAAKGPWARRAPPAAEPAQEIDWSTYLSPIKTTPAAAGEQVAPFSGFAISVETDPPGAIIAIGGVARGEAPVLANVDCAGGSSVELRAEKAGFRPARRDVSCRADTLVKLTLHLDER